MESPGFQHAAVRCTAGRLKSRFSAVLLSSVFLLSAVACFNAAAVACPFCGPVAEPLASRRARSTTVAVAETLGPAVAAVDGRRQQPLRILSTVTASAAGSQLIPADPSQPPVQAAVTDDFTGTALLFQSRAGDWQALAADELLIGYCLSAPPPADQPTQEAVRLRWFARWLEHTNAAIAADAYAEFAVAPFTAVRDAADAFAADRLADWVADPTIDQQRRGFYGLAAGLVARRQTGPAAARCREAVITAVSASPTSDFRAGYDGLLAGLFVALGSDALPVIESLGLLEPDASPVDQRHLLQALRFCWEEPAETLPQAAVVTATRRLLASANLAREAVIDLARYRAWDACSDVAALWNTGDEADALLRTAVVGFLLACPTPAAKQTLERLRKQDAAAVEAAVKAARLPLPAAG